MIAAFDLDGTLLKQNGSLAFCDFLCEKGFLSKRDMLYYAFTYARHMFFGLPFWDLHCLIFEQSFRGCSPASLQPYLTQFLDEKLENLWYAPAILRLERMRKRGFECMILSNSPSFFVSQVAKKLGVEKVFATEYQVDAEGKFSQLTLLMDGERKKQELLSMDSKNIVAFSDSHHDLPFLEVANIPVAVNPRRRLRQVARNRGWEIL
jgi:HAD superfamily phosphoserine phosphatase-like hydrolase